MFRRRYKSGVPRQGDFCMDGPSRMGCSCHQKLWVEAREMRGSSRRLLLGAEKGIFRERGLRKHAGSFSCFDSAVNLTVTDDGVVVNLLPADAAG